MKILRSYYKSENAHLAATLLRNAGIEAIVVDDSALGGNVLGMMKNAIRIEVAESDFERAQEILQSSEEAEED